jgi:hypothetical protein
MPYDNLPNVLQRNGDYLKPDKKLGVSVTIRVGATQLDLMNNDNELVSQAISQSLISSFLRRNVNYEETF